MTFLRALRVLRGELLCGLKPTLLALGLATPVAFAQGRPPVITNQPTSHLVVTGSVVTFTVGVSSPTTPPRFQWLRDGGTVIGQTNASLVITNASASSAGSYSVQVANAAGTVTSEIAVLMSAQVQAPSVSIGADAVLRALVQGVVLPNTYQWYRTTASWICG